MGFSSNGLKIIVEFGVKNYVKNEEMEEICEALYKILNKKFKKKDKYKGVCEVRIGAIDDDKIKELEKFTKVNLKDNLKRLKNEEKKTKN